MVSDVEGIINVYASKGFYKYSPSRFSPDLVRRTVQSYLSESVRNPEKTIFAIASIKNDISGFCIARGVHSSNWEIQIGVHTDFQRRGVGQSLVVWTLQELNGRNADECTAVVHAENLASIKLLEPYFPQQREIPHLDGYREFKALLKQHALGPSGSGP